MVFGTADGFDDAFADASDNRFFGRATHQALELGPDRDARPRFQLNAVLANTIEGLPAFDGVGAVNDFGINAGLDGVEDITACQIDGGRSFPREVDTGFMSRDAG